MSDKRQMDIVVALFERGYAEEHIHKVKDQAKTLNKALLLLSKQGIAPDPATPSKKRPLEAPAARVSVRRRLSFGEKPRGRKSSILESPGRRKPATPQRNVHASPGRRRSSMLCASPGAMLFNEDEETCAICCCDFDRHECVRLPCRHGWYCQDCLQRHADARLSQGAAELQCPECREHIPEHHLRKLLSKDALQKLHSRSVEQAMASSGNILPCPTPNCTFAVEVDDGEEPRLDKCPLCKKSSCLKCGAQPYHKGMSCSAWRKLNDLNSKHEKSFIKWCTKTGTKICPGCKIPISKEHLESQNTQQRECHKMMCRLCKTRFCFKCLHIFTGESTCDCTSDIHGFIDPVTGKRRAHRVAEVRLRRAQEAFSPEEVKTPRGRPRASVTPNDTNKTKAGAKAKAKAKASPKSPRTPRGPGRPPSAAAAKAKVKAKAKAKAKCKA